MAEKKKLTTNAGAPVPDNRNVMTPHNSGSDNERRKLHE